MGFGETIRDVAGGPVRALTSPIRAAASHSYRVPLCVPYWNRHTYLALLRDVLTGRVVDGPATDRLAGALREMFSVAVALPCDSGRTALELALRLHGVSPGEEVVIPTFCCRSIVEPIRRVGATPVFADVGPELNMTPGTVEEAVTPRTGAVIVPHLFGNPAPMPEIEALLGRHGIPVIDDAAQALGASLDGRLAGTFGEAGVVSFGKGKVCFGTGGGVLLIREENCRRQDLQDRVLECADGASRAVRDALAVTVWRTWRKWSLPVGMALRKAGWHGNGAREPRRGAIGNLSADVALTLLETLEANLAARRERVASYRERLGSSADFRLIAHGPGSACLSQVVEVDPQSAGRITTDALLRNLRQHGFEVTRSYSPLHCQSDMSDYPRASDLSGIEATARRLIELPCEPSVELTHVNMICDVLHTEIARSH